MPENNIKGYNLKLFNEFDIYNNQYMFAIFRLLDNNPDVMNMYLPLANLIYQKIENEIKLYISEPHKNNETFKDLNISNTHILKELLEREELKKYYDGISECEEIYKDYKNSVLYFFTVFGQDSFLKSRYPIQTNKNEITNKNKINIEEFYQKWTEYCIASGKLSLIYVAYCSSNLIIHLKETGKINNNEEEYIRSMVEESFDKDTAINIEKEKEELTCLINEFVRRKRYIDKSYIC